MILVQYILKEKYMIPKSLWVNILIAANDYINFSIQEEWKSSNLHFIVISLF